MERFLTAGAEGPDWRTTAEACLDRLGDVPDEANLGFVYATDALANDMRRIVDCLKIHTGVSHWVGTVGTGICHDDCEHYEAPAVAVMICSFPEDSFRVFSTLDGDLGSLADKYEAWYSQHPYHLGVVHGDPRSSLTPELIPLLAETVPQTYLVGGLSSSSGSYPQYADQLCEGSISGVLFSDRVPAATSLTQGCSPIGGKHVISKSYRNVVSSIDGQAALDVFKEEIGEVLARDLRRAGGYIFVGLPIPGSDTGDYVVRNLMGIDPQKKELIIGDVVESGQPILFCRRDGSSAWEDLTRALQTLKKRATTPIKGALYFSCLGRGRYLFGENSEELKAVQAELGDVPLVGFFANGEIANNQLYGYTGVLTLFL
jgi:small ligand-binding sensory domain FIST